jgi:hypothetical protein
MNEYANTLKETLISLMREMSPTPAPMSKNTIKILHERRCCSLRRLGSFLSPWEVTAYIMNSWIHRVTM